MAYGYHVYLVSGRLGFDLTTTSIERLSKLVLAASLEALGNIKFHTQSFFFLLLWCAFNQYNVWLFLIQTYAFDKTTTFFSLYQ
jgi:hypothetical protein